VKGRTLRRLRFAELRMEPSFRGAMRWILAR
jgi:hypothetical protein